MTKKQLLLVEDDRALAEPRHLAFRARGFRRAPHRRRRGSPAARRRESPDVILLDWMIEGILGHRGLPPASPPRRDRQRADHHAHRARRGERPDPRPRDRRRRLCHQAVQPARAGRPRRRGAAPGPARRWPASSSAYADVEMDVAAHRVRRGGRAGRARPDRVPAAPPFPRTSGPGLFARAAARFGLVARSRHRAAHRRRPCPPASQGAQRRRSGRTSSGPSARPAIRSTPKPERHPRTSSQNETIQSFSESRAALLEEGCQRRCRRPFHRGLLKCLPRSLALAGVALIATTVSTAGRSPHADACRRLVDRLSVRQDRRGARRPRQSGARHADHRIDRHRRRHEIVLRWRRRALPRHRECLAPDEGLGSQAVRRQRRRPRSPKSRSASTASRSRPRRARRSPTSRTRDIYLALAKTPFGKPNKAKTWKDVNGKLPALPIRVYGPPPTSGTRDALGELIMTAGCDSQPGDGRDQEEPTRPSSRRSAPACAKTARYIEAGENDNLIVQKLEANPGTVGIFGYSFLEENADLLKGLAINGVAPTYDTISCVQISGRPAALHLRQERPRRRDPGDPRLRR